MPKYKTHLFGGLITFLIIFFILYSLRVPLNYILVYLIASLIGSLFPDIDTKSMIQKFVYFFLFLIMLWAIFAKKWHFAAITGLIALVPMIINHRRLTHRTWFIIFMPLVIPITIYYYYPNLIIPAFFTYIFFVGGELSHIWLDFGLKRRHFRK